jgi:anti-sigma factor RsiW
MAGCHDLIKQLSAYADGELDANLCAELKRHLEGCVDCRLMLDRLTMTVKLCREGKCEELPSALQQKLDSALARRWRRKFGHR